MGFDFTGHALRGARVSPVNAPATAEPSTGVIRDVKALPAVYGMSTSAPPVVDAAAEQFRTAILSAPGSTTVEYMVWAQNSGQLATVEDPAWFTERGTGSIPPGTLVVKDSTPPKINEGDPIPANYGQFLDGTSRVIVVDNGGRTIGRIIALVVARGDVDTYDDDGWSNPDWTTIPNAGRDGDVPYQVLHIASADQEPDAGIVRLTAAQVGLFDDAATGGNATLGGGLSRQRGDRIIAVRFAVAAPKFWWTRNDRYEKRFGWSDKYQRWEPYKGTAPKNLGRLLFDQTYQLGPKPKPLPVNSILPGDGTIADKYAMIRLGTNPGALSTPVGPDGTFVGVRVRADEEVEEGFDFSRDPQVCAVIGQTSGILEFNPEYVKVHAGKTIWYSYQGFDPEAKGVIGKLRGASQTPRFLAPIPGPTDYPFIKLGSRRYLTPILVDTDGDFDDFSDGTRPPLTTGQVAVSLSTGRLLLADEDVDKADPKKVASFDKHFLGEDIIYDGVALNSKPQPTRAATPLVGSNGQVAQDAGDGDLFLPDAAYLPTDFTANSALDPNRGLGTSGVLDVPDGTGAIPNASPASVRPGGDALGAVNASGKVRQIDGVGDTILFGKNGAITHLRVVNDKSGFPTFAFQVDSDEAFIAKKVGGGEPGSQVMIDTSRFAGNPIYFLQAGLTPASYTDQARLISRSRDIFRFEGGEELRFLINNQNVIWQADPLIAANPSRTFFMAEEVAADINTAIVAVNPDGSRAFALNGRVVLEAADPTNVLSHIEIAFGTNVGGVGIKDISGAAVLGFLPGWRVHGGMTNWLPDSGATLGLYRSPLNKDRSRETADFRARDRVENEILTESVAATPFFFLNQPPLQDVAGVDEGIFFNLTNVIVEGDTVTIINKPLEHYGEIIHRFGQAKFDWVERDTVTGVIERPTVTLALGNPAVATESMLAAPGIGGGLSVAFSGGSFVLQDQDNDYVLPNEGGPGTALLVERFGKQTAFGGRGTFVKGHTTFTDPNGNFLGDSTIPDLDSGGKQKTDVNGDLLWLPKVQAGYRLKITSGDAQGSYLVKTVTDGSNLEVTPAFLSHPARPVPWEVFSGFEDSVYDPGLVADAVFEEFNHLAVEPFKVRLLSYLGKCPADGVAQKAGRLRADLERALESKRIIGLRFGLVKASTAPVVSLTPLARTKLGPIGNNLLFLPDITSAKYTSQAFAIRVGPVSFTHTAGTLKPVAMFTDDPGTNIEYLTTNVVDATGKALVKGLLKFGSTVLADYGSANVYHDEQFFEAADVPPGTAEYDALTGILNLGATEMAAHKDVRVYFVEQMVTERRLDVAINPLLGAFAFTHPIQKDQAVEVEYFKADLEGRKVGDATTEFLPVFVRSEDAVRVKQNVYTFNADMRTVDTRIEPVVYIGPVMQNFADTDYIIEYPAELNGLGRMTFVSKVVREDLPVKITYAVFEANGGEKVYEASQKPLYRPPFFIAEKQSQFGLRGDRTAEFLPGQMLRIGAECFYIRSLTYFPPSIKMVDGKPVAKGDVTAVGFFPPTLLEVGSRAPGNDVLSLITSTPVTPTVDPDGDAPVQTTAPQGFLLSVNTTAFPMENVVRGQKAVTFRGDLTRFAIPGHILEIQGRPFTIASATLDESGSRTNFKLTAAFTVGISMDENPTVRLSCRPIYPPQTRNLLGVAPFLDTEPHEVVLFGEKDAAGLEQPGRSLIRTVDYDIEPDTGNIKLLKPAQKPFGSAQRMFLSYTKVKALQPLVSMGTLIQPRWLADYLHVSPPSVDNGLLGGQVTATYSFHHPDTFYFRAVPMIRFLGEAVKEAVKEIQSKQPAGGAIRTSAGSNNWERGRTGLRSERSHLFDKDRASRVFLEFYNTTIVTFEQVLEAIDGGLVGDRDGKFKFWVGRGRDFAGPGFEDDISGRLNPRYAFAQAFNNFRLVKGQSEMTLATDDFIVEPASASFDGDLTVDGDSIDGDLFDRLTVAQRGLVQNDVDDLVVVWLGRATIVFTFSFPFFKLKHKGVVRRMADSHNLSRVFPGVAKGFFTIWPGTLNNPDKGDPGVYTFLKPTTDGIKSTFLRGSGQVQNPVLGPIDRISDYILYKRRARARIWGYFPNGLKAGAINITNPCVVAVPTQLRDLIIDPATGFIDTTKLIAMGGGLPDAVAGDPTLSIPGFAPGDQVGWGKPTGEKYAAFYNESVGVFTSSTLAGLYVAKVEYGCIITFADGPDGSVITDPSDILVGTGPDSGIPAHEFAIERGDTLYNVSPVSADEDDEPEDPPTFAVFQKAAGAMEPFRGGFDVVVRGDGRVLDMTLPSFSDPFFFGLKEILGQNPPNPMKPVEGIFDFAYVKQNPLKIPALEGKAQDDSGDYQIPYLATGNTEKDRFDEIQVGLVKVMTTNDDTGLSVYPDEIVALDAALDVDNLTRDPGVLHLPTSNLLPASTLGVEPVRPFDLMLVEVGQAGLPGGSTGMLSVGEVTGTTLEPPRFVTQTNVGSPIRYHLQNVPAWVDASYSGDPQNDPIPPAGVEVIEDLSANTLTLEFQSVGALDLAGLQNIWAADPNNIIRLVAYSRQDPVVENGPNANPPLMGQALLTITIQGMNLEVVDHTGAVLSAFVMPANPVFGLGQQIVLSLIPANPAVFVAPAPGPGTTNEWYVPHVFTLINTRTSVYGFEFAFEIDTRAGRSTTAWVASDRLTFNEEVDFRLAYDRTKTHSINGLSFAAKLLVTEVSCDGGVFRPTNQLVNGDAGGGVGIPFDFLPRFGDAADSAGGNFAGGVGSIKVLAWEGHNNTLLAPQTSVKVAAVPSNHRFENGVICQGTGTASFANRVSLITPLAGDLGNVQGGDILVIRQSSDPANIATSFAGTWVVRHAVAPTGVNDYRKLTGSSLLGNGSGWAKTKFPTAVSYDTGANELVVNGQTNNFPATGTVFVVHDISKLSDADPLVYDQAVSFCAYTAVVQAGEQATFTLTNNAWKDARGNAITEAAASLRIVDGQSVSGMTSLDINLGGLGGLATGLNMVGHHAGGVATMGFVAISCRPPTFDKGTFDNVQVFTHFQVSSNPGPNFIGVGTATPVLGTFSDPESYLYAQVPDTLYASGIQNAIWDAMTDPQAHGGQVRCLLPGMTLTLDQRNPDNSLLANPEGFFAQAGIFIEPNVPTQGLDLNDAAPQVVDNSNSLPVGSVGMIGAAEGVTFEVRRIRRWHKVQDDVNGNLTPLRFAYEIRRGVVTTYTTQSNQFGTLDASGFSMNFAGGGNVKPLDVWVDQTGPHQGTNLGGFNNPDVNVNVGDCVRLLDAAGLVIEEAEVASVVNATRIKLAPPGFVSQVNDAAYVGLRFEVYLKQAPVPHEQSNEQLLDLMTTKEVMRTDADWATERGGYCLFANQDYEGSANKLYDSLNVDGTGGKTYGSKGVLKGDIVIVDPLGTIPQVNNLPAVPEVGVGPKGDQGIVERLGNDSLGNPIFQGGSPNPTDDNRGYYRVKKVDDANTPPRLELEPLSTFAGPGTSPVVFPAGNPGTYGYAVYPTVHESGLNQPPFVNPDPGAGQRVEGQMDLRPTLPRDAVTKTFAKDSLGADTPHSVQPFSYRVIRPSSLFRKQTVDLILMMRERMLSWMEELKSPMSGRKSGTFFVFQKDEHIVDIGSPTDGTDGLGVFRNVTITSLVGRTTVTPFANTEDCLSLLDRRFWILDDRLDELEPKPGSPVEMQKQVGATSYTEFNSVVGGVVRPVLPDLVAEVLDRKDRFRPLRYMWLAYRTHRILGTLAAIGRFDEELPEREREQLRALQMQESADAVEGI